VNLLRLVFRTLTHSGKSGHGPFIGRFDKPASIASMTGKSWSAIR
jgi:hypothetical protein